MTAQRRNPNPYQG